MQASFRRASVFGGLTLLLGSGAGCSLANDSSDVASEDRMTYVTLKAEWAEVVVEAMAPEVQWIEDLGDIQILALPESELGRLSQVTHEASGRCGGFLSHDTLSDARVEAERFRNPVFDVVTVDYTLDRASVVEAILPALSEDLLVETIARLESYGSRYHTLATAADAADWLGSKWSELSRGRTDVGVELVPWRSDSMPNVEMTIRGRAEPTQWIIVGGHLDSTSSLRADAPGADDDASGIATITEIARVLLESNYEPDYSIAFYGYAAEEIGLRGSRFLAERARARGQEILGVLQFDMTNYPESDNLDGTILSDPDFTDANLVRFALNVIERYTDYTFATSRCGYACSDHASWQAQGYPSIMPFESHFDDFERGRIHTPNDTFERSNYEVNHAFKFAKLGAALVIELAKGRIRPPPATPPAPPEENPATPTPPSACLDCDPEISPGSRSVDDSESRAVVGSSCSSVGRSSSSFGWELIVLLLGIKRAQVRRRARLSRRTGST